MSRDNLDQLEIQVADARRSIASDGYPMSIGEITNLYRDGELVIRPEFQRFFRWTTEQRSRLVESLLLGIPLPSIFVAQREDGKWELVDGLQRLSTILELQGELLGPDGKPMEPLALKPTKFLPSLAGRKWHDPDPAKSLSPALRLDVKRTKIDIKIIKRESSSQAKYDLFQRLNSFGSSLTAQEMRSALLVAVSPDFLAWLESLASYPSFVNTTMLSDRLIDERYDLELVLRFLVLHNRPSSMLTQSALSDFPQILDEESVMLALTYPKGDVTLCDIFKRTFDTVARSAGEKLFRRWDVAKQEFAGSFLNTAFEVFALGIGYHVAHGTSVHSDLIEVAKRFWERPEMESGFATGKATQTRLARFVPLGRELVALP